MYGNGGSDVNAYKNPNTSAPSPISPLQEVMQRQERYVDTLHDRIGQVEMRLEGVLLPTVPTPANRAGGGEVVASMSQHHMRGSVLADRIEQAIARLEDLLHRLQV